MLQGIVGLDPIASNDTAFHKASKTCNQGHRTLLIPPNTVTRHVTKLSFKGAPENNT
jgi:hypothetical protein